MPSSYVRPVQGAVRRLDQGIDFQGKPGDHVVSIGLARVDYVKDDPGGFGKTIYYTLLSGPNKGQQIYVGHAQPNVYAGQILQAGDPVATLLERGLGNASGLAGWTEIGFAKGGVPQPGSARRFQVFLKGLGKGVASSTVPAAQAQPVAAPTEPLSPQVADYSASAFPPDPSSTHPLIATPGSGPTNYGPPSLWQMVTSQPNVSQDTLAYAQNASIAGG